MRNIGKHTDVATARARILEQLKDSNTQNLFSLSTLGYAAFEGYNLRPQGAALAVSRIVNAMTKDGLIRWSCESDYKGRMRRWGYYITGKGREELQS